MHRLETLSVVYGEERACQVLHRKRVREKGKEKYRRDAKPLKCELLLFQLGTWQLGQKVYLGLESSGYYWPGQ